MGRVNRIATLALLLILSLATVGLLFMGYLALTYIRDAAEKVTRIAEIVETLELPDVELDPANLAPSDLPELPDLDLPAPSISRFANPDSVAQSDDPNQFPGICGRTPAVQETLIYRLEIPSCRAITAGELYRVEELEVRTESLKPGDFANLPNLRRLSVSIPRHDWAKHPLTPGLFADLSGLEELGIGIGEPYPAPNVTVRIDKELFEGLSNLKRLSIGKIDQLSSDAFDNTPALESIQLQGESDDNGKPRFHRELVRNLPYLMELRASNFDMPQTLAVANPRVACFLADRIDSVESLSIDGESVEVLERDSESCRVIIGDDRVVTVDLTQINR